MSRHRQHMRRGSDGRLARNGARQEIVDAANKNRGWSTKPFSQRRINDAVCVVRRRRLVSDEVLVEAGFNMVRFTPTRGTQVRNTPKDSSGRGVVPPPRRPGRRAKAA